MKNLKKTLAVVLAFAMVFSMGIINTFAFSDVEAGTVVDEAVGILSNLKILEGFEDGTFKPEETVTRAQMAAIICRTLGYESQAQSSKGTTAFTDVAADSWASGYINVAQAQGIINGYGNGMFGPNDKVTYEQAVKMIVAALGYDIVAAAKGGYPTGYLAIASSEGITKNANGRVGDAALRSTVAILVYNALEVRLMDQNSWSTDGSDKYGKTADTILSKYLNVNKWEGILEDDMYTTFAKGYEEDAVERISLDAKAFYKAYYQNGDTITLEKYDQDDAEFPAKDVNASLVDTTGLLGKKVIAYIGAYEDPETDEPMVYAINEKSRANETVAINALQLDTENDDADSEKSKDGAGLIFYTVAGSTKVQKLELATSPVIYKNYTVSSATVKDTKTLDDLVGSYGGTIEFISNDTDDEIEYIIVKSYDGEAVIEEVTENNGKYSYEAYAGSLKRIDTNDEDALHIVYKDGVEADVAAIEAGNTVSYCKLGSNVIMYYVSSKTVTGAVESYDDEVLVINGEEYELSSGSPVDYAGQEGTFYINVDGRIAHAEASDVTSGTPGMLLAIAQGDDFDAGVFEARVALADGSVAIYELAKSAKFYAKGSKKADETTAKGTAVAAEKAIAGTELVKDAGKSYTTTYDVANKAIFNFTFKDGKISAIKALEFDGTPSTKTDVYDAEDNSFGSFDFANDAVVFAFNVKSSSAKIEANKLTVGAISAFFSDKETDKDFTSFDIDDDGYEDILLGFELKPGVPEDGALVVITGKKNITYNDDEAVQITGIQAGEEVTYTLYAGEDNEFAKSHLAEHTCKTGDGGCIAVAGEKCFKAYYNDPIGLAKGDVILVSTPSAEGVVSNYRLVYSEQGKEILDVTANNTDEDIFTAYDVLAKVVNDRFFLKNDIKNKAGETFAVASEGMRMAAKANYTLVDYTESTKNPTIEADSAKSALDADEDYVTRVLVRVYDNRIVDVVVYRSNKK